MLINIILNNQLPDNTFQREFEILETFKPIFIIIAVILLIITIYYVVIEIIDSKKHKKEIQIDVKKSAENSTVIAHKTIVVDDDLIQKEINIIKEYSDNTNQLTISEKEILEKSLISLSSDEKWSNKDKRAVRNLLSKIHSLSIDDDMLAESTISMLTYINKK